MNNKKSGFTLAEILITLTIIGVISALAIPALYTNIQDAQLKNVWKKFYSDFSQTTLECLNNVGGSFQGVCESDDRGCLINMYKQHISYVKECNYHESYGNCWHNPAEMKYLNGDILTDASASNTFGNAPALVMNNGAYAMIFAWPDTCNSGGQCGWAYVDVNGKNLPNTIGKDIFGMTIFPNRIIPKGYNNTAGCDPTGQGFGCAALYIKQ